MQCVIQYLPRTELPGSYNLSVATTAQIQLPEQMIGSAERCLSPQFMMKSTRD